MNFDLGSRRPLGREFYAVHIVRVGGQRLVYLFGGPEALRELSAALQSYADEAENGVREWGSVAGGTVAFVGCLSPDDAETEAKAFLERCKSQNDFHEAGGH